MSVRKRQWKTRSGVTTVWLVDYKDQHGQRQHKHFDRKADAESFHDRARVDVRRGTHVSSTKSPLVSEAAERWYRRVEADGMNGDGPAERSTLRQYRQHIDLHIVPRIGGTKVGQLTQPAIEKFRDDLLATLSRALARKVFTSFRSILKTVGCVHLADNVSFGREKRRRRLEVGRNLPSPDEIKRLMKAIAPDDSRGRALLSTVAFTGLRSSELRGCRWKDVDFKSHQIHVRQRADRFNRIGSPKSEKGLRTVPLGEITLDALRAWKLKSLHSKADDYVFGTRTGHIVGQGKMLTALSALMIEAELLDDEGKPKYGLHAMRHFFASWCINAKDSGGRELPAKLVQELLGHSTIAMTLDLYGHLFPNKNDRDELNLAVRQLLG